MKFLLALLVSLNAYSSFDPRFYADVKVMEDDLALTAQQDGILLSILEKQVKRIVHSFMNDKMRSEDVVKQFEFRMNKATIKSPEDVRLITALFLREIYGDKILDILTKILGMEEVKKALLSIYEGFQLIQEDPTCEQGFTKMGTGISYIVGYVAVYYYFQANPAATVLANAGGMIAQEACRLVINVTDIDQITCDWLFKRPSKPIFN